jgi:hypothetical protein
VNTHLFYPQGFLSGITSFPPYHRPHDRVADLRVVQTSSGPSCLLVLGFNSLDLLLASQIVNTHTLIDDWDPYPALGRAQ